MKVLVVGGGGREHALVWKLKQSSRISKVYCAPGNAGTAQLAENIAIKATDLAAMTEFAKKEKIDLVVVAPDDPLALGMVDELSKAGIRAFGPTAAAAQIEASKAFAKKLMQKYGIPTADYNVFSELQSANDYLNDCVFPIVIKADGLALGKGVVIAQTKEEAKEAVRMMMEESAFGTAGNTVVIEQFLQGPELTVLAFADGKTVVPMISSRDHKRALDNDQGLNTGGMGAIAPGSDLNEDQDKWLQKNIFQPTIDAMNAEGIPFKGVIYFGLMLTALGPKVIEYNARFGDPEAQAVLPLLQTDLLDIIDACIDGDLAKTEIKWKQKNSCVVVMASGGYPGAYQTGKIISGLNDVDEGIVFHAGTKFDNGEVVTSGGRVLGITALGDSREEAIDNAYKQIVKISFDSCHYRKDIGRT